MIEETKSKTIAVLPFVNMSIDQENEFFCDGITEEIINALAKIKGLRVTSRTSSFVYKNKNIPLQQIAEALRVDTILEGSVRLAQEKVRITAQLIDAKEDYHFWSETWDRKLDDIFQVQDEISLLIADKLREHLGHFEIQQQLVKEQTGSIEAYELFLKANYHYKKWNAQDVSKAIDLYQAAIQIDANYTAAYVGIADSYSFLATIGQMDYMEGWKESSRYTQIAQRLDEQHAGVHYLLSHHAFFVESHYEKALTEMLKAVELNPNYAEALQYLSFLYIIYGDEKRAKKYLNQALALNPLSAETRFFKAHFHYMMGDFEVASDLLDELLRENSHNIPAHAVKATCLLLQGEYEKAKVYYHEIPQEVVVKDEQIGVLCLAHAMTQQEEKAQEYLTLLKEKAAELDGMTADVFVFLYLASTEAIDEAYEWVDNALKKNISILLLRYVDPLAKELKKDSRYHEYHQKIFGKGQKEPKEATNKALLDDKTADYFKEKLRAIFNQSKPFLDSDLSLRSLAEQLQIHPNHLSWLINQRFQKNFNDLINHYRLEAFQQLAKTKAAQSLTIMGMAYESGFNSKTVFNAYFKKSLGITPKQYLKSL